MLSPTSPLRLMCDFKSIFKKFKSNIERPTRKCNQNEGTSI